MFWWNQSLGTGGFFATHDWRTCKVGCNHAS